MAKAEEVPGLPARRAALRMLDGVLRRGETLEQNEAAALRGLPASDAGLARAIAAETLRWLVDFARKRRENTMTERLMNEILDASNGLGAAVKRREDMHKMAESNKAFAHYRW